MRLARRVRLARLAKQKHVRTANAPADDKIVSTGLCLAPLNQIELTVNIEAITTTAGNFRNHLKTFAVLDSHPFRLLDVNGRIAEIKRGGVSYPNIFSKIY